MTNFYDKYKKETDVFLCKVVKHENLYNPNAVDAARRLLEERGVSSVRNKHRYVEKNPHNCRYSDFKCQFKDGVKMVKDGTYYGLVDSKGSELLPSVYDSIELLEYDTIRVKRNNRYGIVDMENNQILPCEFDYIDDFYNGICRVKQNDRFGYINRDGRIIIEPQYSFADISFKNGMAIVCKYGLYGVINIAGRELTPINYDFIIHIDDNGVVLANRDSKIEFIDTSKDLILESHADYPDFFSLMSNPTLFSINGIGTGFCGKLRKNSENGSYTTIRWITILFLPIIPLDSWRVTKISRGFFSKTYDIHYRAKVPPGDIIMIWMASILFIISFIAMII